MSSVFFMLFLHSILTVLEIQPHYVPNFEEVEGAYCFRVVCACMRACVRPSVRTSIRSSHFLMHAISYEPYILGF